MKSKQSTNENYSEGSFALRRKLLLSAEVTDFTPTYLYKFWDLYPSRPEILPHLGHSPNKPYDITRVAQ